MKDKIINPKPEEQKPNCMYKLAYKINLKVSF